MIISGPSFGREINLQRFFHQLHLSDGNPSTLIYMMVVPPFPNRTSLLTFYFPEETSDHEILPEPTDMMNGVIPHYEYNDEMFVTNMSQFINIVQSKSIFSFDTFGV